MFWISIIKCTRVIFYMFIDRKVSKENVGFTHQWGCYSATKYLCCQSKYTLHQEG